MEVHFTLEQEARISEIASQNGTNAEQLVKEETMRLLDAGERFRAAVREGIDETPLDGDSLQRPWNDLPASRSDSPHLAWRAG